MEKSSSSSFPTNILDKIIDSQIIVVPFPLQGHVAPMTKLSWCIASHGIKVALVITEHNYKRIVHEVNDQKGEINYPVRLVAVPDGLEPDNDRKDESTLAASVSKVMPVHVHNLIAEARRCAGNDCQITCLIADIMFGWAMDIANKANIKLAMFWSSSPGALALTLKIPELMESGVIDQEGTTLKKDGIGLLPDMPSMKIIELPWYCPDNPTLQKTMFNYFRASEGVAKSTRWMLCNWFHALSPSSAQVAMKNVVPIGPLRANAQPRVTLKPGDATCLTWLDQQPLRSVIYVAFGSISTIAQNQLDELASGLVLSGRPFLWVIRKGRTSDSPIRLPNEFGTKFAGFGKVVEWASQETVLAHRSIACFLTHCGWNSTMEGLSNGVPLLCWPCFADQPYTQSCISDAWKIGITLVPDESSRIISAHEIKRKLEELLSRDELAKNSLKLKEIAKKSVIEGGSSFLAVQNFIKQIQG